MISKNTGFTLIELIIVLIIIGILATITAPMMSGMQEKAIKTEAITALGVIRDAQRAYYVEYGSYAYVTNFGVTNQLSMYLPPKALNGRYFSENCYKSSNIDAQTLANWLAAQTDTQDLLLILHLYNQNNVAACFSSQSTAPSKDKVLNFKNIYMANNVTFESQGTLPI